MGLYMRLLPWTVLDVNNSSSLRQLWGEGQFQLGSTSASLKCPFLLVRIYLAEFRLEFLLLIHSIRRDDVSELTRKKYLAWLIILVAYQGSKDISLLNSVSSLALCFRIYWVQVPLPLSLGYIWVTVVLFLLVSLWSRVTSVIRLKKVNAFNTEPMGC